MEKGTNKQTGQPQVAEDARLEALFEHASRRPEPPKADREAVMQAVQSEWRAVTGKRRQRRRIAAFAIAASVAAAIVLAIPQNPEGPVDIQPVQFARVEKTTGNVRLMTPDSDKVAVLAREMAVFSGQVIRTADQSGVALYLDSGIALRIDQDTEISLADGGKLELITGRVYVDTHAGTSPYPLRGTSRPLEIITARGAVTHTGTQYTVRMLAQNLDVRVREGSVEVTDVSSDASEPLRVGRGQGIAISAAGESELQEIDSHGEEWEWAEALGQGYVLDGRTLDDFFNWVASETGLEISYSSDEARAIAETTVLHGKIDLPPRQAVDVVLMTSDLSATIQDGVIGISLKP